MYSEFVAFVRKLFGTDRHIPLHAPRFEGRERDYILNTIDSTLVSSIGEYVTEFEERISDYTGARQAVAMVNGTTALHVALLLADVGHDDEVITQSLTFVATSNAISYCGAHPVFVDVERSSLGMSPRSLSAFLEEYAEIRDDGLCWNRKTNRILRACVPVHDLGHPVDIIAISALCEKYNVALVEDAAESLGSFSKGKHTGRVGLMGTLSFNGNKIITTGGGGALITDDEKIGKRARHITTTAKISHPWKFLHDEVGYNYRMPNLNAALGCAQIERLPIYVARKRALAERYRTWFEGKNYEFITEPLDAKSNYWINAILVEGKEERDNFLKFTNDNGVMTRPLWTPMHTLPMYKNCTKVELKTTEWLEERVVNIPSSVV